MVQLGTEFDAQTPTQVQNRQQDQAAPRMELHHGSGIICTSFGFDVQAHALKISGRRFASVG